MKKVSGRAFFPLILAIVLLAGTVLLCVRYFAKADEWVTFSGSPHVYTGVNLDGGVVYDRDGTLLLDSTDGRTYSADAATRTATMHLLGDRYGYIQAPLLGSFADDMIGFDKINQLRHVRFLKDKAHTLELMKQHAAILAPKFHAVLDALDREIAPLEIAQYKRPVGYFISLDAMPGTAKRVVQLCREAGVTLTGAGATFPYGVDPADSNIRIAPSLPPVEELQQAIAVLCNSLKLAALEKMGL